MRRRETTKRNRTQPAFPQNARQREETSGAAEVTATDSGGIGFLCPARKARLLLRLSPPKDFPDRGGGVRHRRARLGVTQLQIPAAEKMIGLDRGRLPESAPHDSDPAFRTPGFGTLKSRIPPVYNSEQVVGVARHDFQEIARLKLGKVQLVAERAFSRLEITQPVAHSRFTPSRGHP